MIGNMKFFDYAVFDSNGNLSAIRPDVPKEVKEEYEHFLKMQKDARKRGTKLIASNQRKE